MPFEDFKEFYDVLKETLEKYPQTYPEFINHGPDLFKLLSDLLNEPEINSETRLKINAAISYYVVPYDIIPESEYGPNGYIDDIFLCIHVIKDMEKSLGYDFLDEIWVGNEDLDKVIDICEKECNEFFDKLDKEGSYIDLRNEILEYTGLKN